MYGWEPKPNAGFRDTFDSQSKSVKSEFADRVSRIKLQFAEKGFNSELFDENKSLARNVSLVPTSAVTGEGLPDLLLLACKLTTERLNERLRFSTEPQATILDVKVIEGMGTTIDVILANGILREGDRLVMCGTEGPIVTNARALMTPPPLRETRVKVSCRNQTLCTQLIPCSRHISTTRKSEQPWVSRSMRRVSRRPWLVLGCTSRRTTTKSRSTKIGPCETSTTFSGTHRRDQAFGWLRRPWALSKRCCRS